MEKCEVLTEFIEVNKILIDIIVKIYEALSVFDTKEEK